MIKFNDWWEKHWYDIFTHDILCYVLNCSRRFLETTSLSAFMHYEKAKFSLIKSIYIYPKIQCFNWCIYLINIINHKKIGHFRVLPFRPYFVFHNLPKSGDLAFFLGIVISGFYSLHCGEEKYNACVININKPVCGVRNSNDFNIDDMIGLMQPKIGFVISKTPLKFNPMTS